MSPTVRVTSSLSLGVVGHVDHGKTALVRALTGMETDRLREEQQRGLSIVLGFSYLETASGSVDLIDAPGHEDFVRTMISGATGFDGVLLCVAANEGPMPQTVEHFNIVRLLGAVRGVVAITKCDLADAAMLASTRSAIADLVRGSFLETAPVIESSVNTGAGIAALAAEIGALAAEPIARQSHDVFFMPLDRAFAMRGFGVVATGTLRWGPIGTDDRVVVMPAGIEASVRGLQNHGHAVSIAAPGQRVAVNLRGLAVADVSRGDVIASPGFLQATTSIDAELELLADAPPLRNGTFVQMLTGTTAVTVRARLLDRRVLEAGERGLVQWRPVQPIATHPSERFVVRMLSPRATIGGGRFVEIGARRHRRFDAAVQERLASAASGDASRVARHRLEAAGAEGVELAVVAAATGIDQSALRSGFNEAGAVEVATGRYVDPARYDEVTARIRAAVEAFHSTEPQRLGPGIAAVAGELDMRVDAPVFRHALDGLIAREELRESGDTLSRPGFDPFARLGDRDRAALEKIEGAFTAAGLAGAPWQQLIGSDRLRQSLFSLLLQSGRLVRLRTYDRAAQIVLHADAIRAAIDEIAGRYPYPSPFAVKDARDLLNSTRRHVVPLLEHLDAIGATERTGDLRRLRQQ